jgi:hypothetical protein
MARIAFTALVSTSGIAHPHRRLHLPPENMSVDQSKISPPGLTALGSDAGALSAAASIISKLAAAVFLPSVATIVFNFMSYYFDRDGRMLGGQSFIQCGL